MTVVRPRDAHAVVVGATGGVGAAVVKALVAQRRYSTVWALGRTMTVPPEAEEASRAPADSDPECRVRRLRVDVTSESSIELAATQFGAELGRSGGYLSLLFNAAGVLHEGRNMRPERRLADVDASSVQRSFAVNALGPLLVAKHFATYLPRRGRSIVANVSARVGSIGDNRLGGWYAYRAAKAAQNMFTRNLAIELRRRAADVICVALHPGTVDTRLSLPFQGNLPSGQMRSPDVAAAQLLQVLDALTSADNGSFKAWDGADIDW
ncbi:MAG: SDR family NAD(P)-dependent oxidoreductase [Pseudomonadota bacterium]